MKYKYIGDGAGIPGLPHEITDEEAAARGLTVLLKDAIEAGVYVEEDGGRRTEDRKIESPKSEIRKIEDRKKKKEKESEVNDG